VTWFSEHVPENDLENEFQFQDQGYAWHGGAVNPQRHERA
jgi:hypothetical protein